MIKIQKINKLLTNKQIYFWVSCLNDKDVTKFSDQKFKQHTFSSQKNFFLKKIKSKNCLLYKIIYRNLFVGIIEISNIDINHKKCEIGFIIGNKYLWGKNIASKAISKICNIAKKKKLRLIYTYVYKNNIASQKALLKNKFKFESKIKNFYLFKEKKTFLKVDCEIYTKNL